MQKSSCPHNDSDIQKRELNTSSLSLKKIAKEVKLAPPEKENLTPQEKILIDRCRRKLITKEREWR